MRCMEGDVYYAGEGLMGETVFGEILADLKREGRSAQAAAFEGSMRTRARAEMVLLCRLGVRWRRTLPIKEGVLLAKAGNGMCLRRGSDLYVLSEVDKVPWVRDPCSSRRLGTLDKGKNASICWQVQIWFRLSC